MKLYTLFVFLMTFSYISCAQQDKINVGGDCEICDAVYESPIPFEKLPSTDTLPDFNDEGLRLKVAGIVFKQDRTPAADVVLYIYHTDQAGVYPRKGDEMGYAKQHGYLRGWIKTDKQGRYTFYTLRPASYPNSSAPAHIHAVVKEPDKNPYWIDDYFFDDDPFVTTRIRDQLQRRGGNGILTLQKLSDNYYAAERDIILGENIPDYP